MRTMTNATTLMLSLLIIMTFAPGHVAAAGDVQVEDIAEEPPTTQAKLICRASPALEASEGLELGFWVGVDARAATPCGGGGGGNGCFEEYVGALRGNATHYADDPANESRLFDFEDGVVTATAEFNTCAI